jgi:hypothetical protein
VCTTLSGAAGCLTALAMGFIRSKAWDLLAVCNGTLVGFVSITAGCAVLEPWAAILAGVTGERPRAAPRLGGRRQCTWHLCLPSPRAAPGSWKLSLPARLGCVLSRRCRLPCRRRGHL